jgi:hypothetical protein
MSSLCENFFLLKMSANFARSEADSTKPWQPQQRHAATARGMDGSKYRSEGRFSGRLQEWRYNSEKLV